MKMCWLLEAAKQEKQPSTRRLFRPGKHKRARWLHARGTHLTPGLYWLSTPRTWMHMHCPHAPFSAAQPPWEVFRYLVLTATTAVSLEPDSSTGGWMGGGKGRGGAVAGSQQETQRETGQEGDSREGS
jgi:hypothetical protein